MATSANKTATFGVKLILKLYVEKPLHSEKLTVWCALWAGGIIESYFFKNDEGHNVTVNGDRYRAMITNFFHSELSNHDVQELWFQQDGATCHTARATIDLLKDTFGDRLISRFGPVNWPPRSCDLTPLDYFLWGIEVIGLWISHKRLTIWKTTFAVLLRYTATNVGKSHRKLDVQIGLHPSQPWQSYAEIIFKM
ncbi:transposase [Trichonephila clavipes]|nr:transposase [Trichonephila clavipes]